MCVEFTSICFSRTLASCDEHIEGMGGTENQTLGLRGIKILTFLTLTMIGILLRVVIHGQVRRSRRQPSLHGQVEMGGALQRRRRPDTEMCGGRGQVTRVGHVRFVQVQGFETRDCAAGFHCALFDTCRWTRVS